MRAIGEGSAIAVGFGVVAKEGNRLESLGLENGRGGSYTDLRDLDVPLRSRAKIVEESGWSTTTVFETVSLLSAAQSAVRRLE